MSVSDMLLMLIIALFYVEVTSKDAKTRPKLLPAELKAIGDNNRWYLTLSTLSEVKVTQGLRFKSPKPWTFDDGSLLGNYNTQQHWVTHSDGLFLVYTRKGANNDHVFRHRAPLFIAQVDTEHLCLIRETERILFPERGARLGNFGVTSVDENQTWITVTEWMQPVGCEKYGSDNAVLDAQIGNGTLNISAGKYKAVIMPSMKIIPANVLIKLQEFEGRDGILIWAGELPDMGASEAEDAIVKQRIQKYQGNQLMDVLNKQLMRKLEIEKSPAEANIFVGHYLRGEKDIYFLVNVEPTDVKVTVRMLRKKRIKVYNPSDGVISESDLPVKILIPGYGGVFIIDK